MTPLRILTSAALLAALSALSPIAAAAPRSHADTDAARVMAEEGYKLYGQDAWARAFEKFRDADALFHAPPLVLYMARCQRKIGRLVAARDLYEKIIAEAIADDAPRAFHEAKADATRELQALRGLIPSIRIVITGLPGEVVRATIDGAPAPVARERVELDPGEHTIEALSERAKRAERRVVTLKEGSAETIEIALDPRLAVVDLAPPPPAPPVEAKGSLVPGAVLLGVAGASLAASAITGALSLGKTATLDAECPNKRCPSSLASTADAARALGDASTATLVIGAASAVAGTVLLIVRPGGRSPASARQGAWSVGLGLGHVDFQRRF